MLIPKSAGDLVKDEEFLWFTAGVCRLYRCAGSEWHQKHEFRRVRGTEFWPDAMPMSYGITVFMAPLMPVAENGSLDVQLLDRTIVFVSSTGQPMWKELTTVC